MTRPHQFESAVVEAAPAAEAPPVVTAPKAAAAKLELLDGDEIIQLSIKPSLWFIPLVALNVVIAAVVLAVLLGFTMGSGLTPVTILPFHVLCSLVALRVGVGTLQWASRLYVLTNRRVLRFKGVMNVSVAECRLAQINAVELHTPRYGSWLRIGTIQMTSADAKCRPCLWRDVARPQEVHEIVTKAVRKAQSK